MRLNSKCSGSPGDVLHTHKETVRKVSLVPMNAPPFVCSPQTTFWRSMNTEVLDRKYLYALLRSPGFQHQLVTRQGETDMAPYVSLSAQRTLSVPLPPIEAQRRVAGVLGPLDDKIDLNNQMNKTLDSITSAIFKHWFIDFEFPNEEGKPYKSYSGEMVYNKEFGKEVPKGWNVGKILEMATQVKEQVSPSEETGETYRHFSIEAYDKGMFPISQPGSEILSNKFRVHDKTILVSKLNPRIQRVWPVIRSPKNGICSTEFLVFRPKGHAFSYFYNLILSSHVWKKLVQRARGTSSSHQRISANDILELPIVVPSQRALNLFEYRVFPNLSRRESNLASRSTLQQVRDSLLPRLVSEKTHSG